MYGYERLLRELHQDYYYTLAYNPFSDFFYRASRKTSSKRIRFCTTNGWPLAHTFLPKKHNERNFTVLRRKSGFVVKPFALPAVAAGGFDHHRR